MKNLREQLLELNDEQLIGTELAFVFSERLKMYRKRK